MLWNHKSAVFLTLVGTSDAGADWGADVEQIAGQVESRYTRVFPSKGTLRVQEFLFKGAPRPRVFGYKGTLSPNFL